MHTKNAMKDYLFDAISISLTYSLLMMSHRSFGSFCGKLLRVLNIGFFGAIEVRERLWPQ